MEPKELFLAADAGGSKTTWALIDRNGESIAEYCTEGLGAAKAGILPVAETVMNAASFFRSYGNPTGIFLSLGGPNVEEVKSALEEAWPSVAVTVEREACGDAILYAASYLDCSAVVMCGTGSTAVGNTDQGRKFCGGWGPIYGDGGSGGGMGSDALKLFLRSLDGLDKCGRIAELFSGLTKGLFIDQFKDRMEVKARSLNMTRRELASLAPSIYRLAEEGDGAALNLYQESAKEIAGMAYAVSTDRSDYKILLCGGFFRNKPLLMEYCHNYFSEISNAQLVYQPNFSPIIAAKIAVLRTNGVIVSDTIVKTILN